MKKHLKNKKFFILIIIVVCLTVAGIVFWLLLVPPSLSGDWILTVNPELESATPDETEKSGKVFYSFSDAGEYGDGVYKTYFGSGVEEGEYKLSEKNGKKYINMGTGDMEYKITGTKLFGSAELTVTLPEHTDEQTGEKAESQKYVFAQSKAPDYKNESYKDYKIDKELLAQWQTKERTLSYYTTELAYTETVKFNDNGVMLIRYESKDLALDRYMYYAYTVKDKTLTFSLVTDKDKKYTVTYDFDEDGNLIFTKDNTSASIFADAFFSDVAYKKVN